MKKRIGAAVLSLLIAGGAIPSVNIFEPGTCEAENVYITGSDYKDIIQGDLKYRVYPDHAELVYCNDEDITEAVIPEEIEGKPLTVIDARVFDMCWDLETVTIPETVTDIGEGAFEDTAWLDSKRSEDPLVIVNGILIDGRKCSGDVIIPDGVKKISGGAFINSAVSSVVIPDSVESIGGGTFTGCRSLKKINIPGSVKSIGIFTFTQCDKLETVEFASGLEVIGISSFTYCKSLKELHFPDTVKEISDNAFACCSGLTSVTLPASLEKIEDTAFCECPDLKEITVPETVTCVDAAKLKALYDMAGYVPAETGPTATPSPIASGSLPVEPSPIAAVVPTVEPSPIAAVVPTVTPSSTASEDPEAASSEAPETNDPEVIPSEIPEEKDPEAIPSEVPETADPTETIGTGYVHGDVNLDGKIDITDITTLAISLVDRIVPDDIHFMYSDLNYDGEVDLLDLATLRSYVSKVITSLPEPKEVSYDRRKTGAEVKPEPVPVSSPVPSAESSAEPSAYPTGYIPAPSDAPGTLPWLDSITFTDTAKAAEIIGNYEDYNYSAKQTAFLSEMNADGFIYVPDQSADIPAEWKNSISIYPASVTEDMHLCYNADYKQKRCYIRIYYAGKERLKRYADEKEYFMKSLYPSQISTLTNVEDTNIYYDGNKVFFFIDDTHYCGITSDGEISDLIEFAKSITFEKISFKENAD